VLYNAYKLRYTSLSAVEHLDGEQLIITKHISGTYYVAY